MSSSPVPFRSFVWGASACPVTQISDLLTGADVTSHKVEVFGYASTPIICLCNSSAAIDFSNASETAQLRNRKKSRNSREPVKKRMRKKGPVAATLNLGSTFTALNEHDRERSILSTWEPGAAQLQEIASFLRLESSARLGESAYGIWTPLENRVGEFVQQHKT